MPAGRDPRRRPGHRLRPDHRARSPRRWSTSPAGRLPTTSSSCCATQGVDRRRLSASATRRADRGRARRRRRWGMRFDYVIDGAEAARHRRRAAAALPLLGDAFFVLYGDSYLDMRLRGGRARFRAERTSRPDDRVPQRRPVGTQQRRVRRRPHRPLRQAARTPEMHHIDYGLGRAHVARPRSPIRRRRRSTWPTSIRICCAAGQLAGYEVDQRFYEIGSPAGLEDTRRVSARRSGAATHDDYTRAAPGRSRADHRRRSTPTRSSASSDVARRRARARRPAVLPRRRRQRRRTASHAVNDFRKIAGFEAYAPTDNVSELTARTNDEGWDTVFVEWLQRQPAAAGRRRVRVLGRRRQPREEHQPQPGARAAVRPARSARAIVGIVGRDGGYTAKVADACVIVPTVNPDTVTPHAEAFQAVVWHLLVSHPALKARATKWESTR